MKKLLFASCCTMVIASSVYAQSPETYVLDNFSRAIQAGQIMVRVGGVVQSLAAWLSGTIPSIAPTAVANLASGSITSTSIAISWTAPSLGTAPITYLVEREITGSGSWSTVAAAQSGATATITGLTASTSYDFRVTPSNATGTGPQTVLSAVSTTSGTAAPTAPTSPSATAGSGQVVVSATAVTATPAVTGYNVLRSTTSGAETTIASNVALPYTNTGLTNGTTYFYTVQAVNAVGTSPSSSEVSATPAATTAAPTAPTGVAAAASPGQVVISANAVTANPAVTGYNILRGTGSGTETLLASNVPLPYTNTGLTNGTTYFYQVQAVNTVGASPNSLEVSATPTAAVATLAVTQPMTNALYQRASYTGGARSLGIGNVPIAVTASAATSVTYGVHYNGGSVGETGTLSVPSGASVIQVPVSAGLAPNTIDLTPTGGTTVVGTSPIEVGDLTFGYGQSKLADLFSKVYRADSGTITSVGLTPSPYGWVYAQWVNAGTTNYYPTAPGWTNMIAAGSGTQYYSPAGTEYLNQMVATTGVAQGLIGMGVGAASISQLQPSGTYMTQLETLLSNANITRARRVFFYQGQGDSILGTTNSSYQAYVLAIYNRLVTDLGSFEFAEGSIGSVINGTQGTPANINTIRAAAKSFASGKSGAYLDLADITLDTGGIHDDAAGNVKTGDHLFRAMTALDGTAGEGDQGPTVVSSAFTSATVQTVTLAQNSGTSYVVTGNLSDKLQFFPSGTTPVNAATASTDSLTSNQLLPTLTMSGNIVTATYSTAPNSNVAVYSNYALDSTNSITSAIRDNVTGDSISTGRQLATNTTPVIATNGFISGTPALTMTSGATYDTATPITGAASLVSNTSNSTTASAQSFGTLAYSSIPARPYTIQCDWKGSAAATGPSVIFGQVQGFFVGTNAANGNIGLISYTSSTATTQVYASPAVAFNGVLTRLAVVVPVSGTPMLYVNAGTTTTGVYAGTPSGGATMNATTAALGIGGYGASGGNYGGAGDIDNCEVLSGALYSGTGSVTMGVPGTVPTDSPRVGLYNFDSSNGNGIASSGGSSGTMYGMLDFSQPLNAITWPAL